MSTCEVRRLDKKCDYKDTIIRLISLRSHFTLNENGWKFAQHIKQLWDVMKDIVPSQEQLDQWNREEYEIRKMQMFADKEAK